MSLACFSQNTKEKPAIQIKKAVSEIKIDGELNETDWQNAAIAKDFFQSFPADTSFAETKTEVRLTYDDKNLYVAAHCYDEFPEKDYIIQSLKRDFSYPVSDAFAVFIDPFDDKLNGFSFSVNPLGAQREGLLQGGAAMGVTTNWDNKWYSKVTRHNDKWVVEMAIPFKTIRYKPGISMWGINFSRNDLKRNESSSWASVPRNFNIASLAYTGDLIWDVPPKKAGTNVSLIPYGIVGYNDNFKDEAPETFSSNIGGDAKIAVSSSLNLDLTFNPDFSQVEVDRQQTNLSRFSLFFPEKRQFFIENSDLFSRFGFRQIRPFFSRNIGLALDSSTFSMQPVPIIAGARLSGKVNKNWRVGLMNIQTAKDANLNVDAQNYTVAAFQRQILKRSNIAAIFVNRQGFNNSEVSYADYNRVAGIDFNYASANSKLMGKAFYHHSFSPENSGGKWNENSTNATWVMYNSQKVFAMWNHEYVGENYLTDVGFVPRNRLYNPEIRVYEGFSYWRFEPFFNLMFYPKSKKINTHGPGLYLNDYYDKDFRSFERRINANYKVKWLNTSELNINFNRHDDRLIYDTDITFSGNEPLPAGAYTYYSNVIRFNSNKRSKLNYNVNTNFGTYYNGTKLSYGGELTYRVQPWGIFSLSFMQNEIRLPEPYGNAFISLIGPKVELSFTKSLFFTTFFQYNTQIDNFNINSRLQWRFKPMSDLFIVYTDNYDTNLSVKNRAVVMKLIWWLTI
ncbi:MAG: hydrolase [Flavobacteriales bacterium]|nr:MAG: hydrolase [Flavobacteriales bacterium]